MKIFNFIWLICFCAYSPIIFSKTHAILDSRIQSIVNQDRITYNLPALSVAIKLPDQSHARNYVSGYFSLEKKRKITESSLFQIGSITKTFTAAIIFNLVEKNELNLSDKLSKWLPQYPKWKNITIDDLLKHTSGVYDYSHGKYFDSLLRKNSNKNYSLEELANIAYIKPVLFKPNQKYHYTNTDYILLGMIIEKITHQSLSNIFLRYFKRYHLSHTYYLPSQYPHYITQNLVHGYNRDGILELNKDVTFINLSFWQSAGAIISTPDDVIKWLYLLFSKKVITAKSLSKMTTVISETNADPINFEKLHMSQQQIKQPFAEIGSGSGMGLLYFKQEGLFWVHAGGTPGYESFYAYNPCTRTYLVLMYNVKPKTQFIFIKIARDIFNILNTYKLSSKNYIQRNWHRLRMVKSFTF